MLWQFFKRYRCIAPGAGALDALLAELEKKGTIPKGEWSKGKTKVFMRNAAAQALEAEREQVCNFVSRSVFLAVALRRIR